MPIKVGESRPEPELCAKVVGILADGMPFTILFPKIKVTSGFSVSFNTDNFANIPFGFKPTSCVPGDPFYEEYEVASAILIAGTGIAVPTAPKNYTVLTGRRALGSAVVLRGRLDDRISCEPSRKDRSMSGEIEVLPPRILKGVIGVDETGLAGMQDPAGILASSVGADASVVAGPGARFCPTVKLTQAQYDALPVKNPRHHVLYHGSLNSGSEDRQPIRQIGLPRVVPAFEDLPRRRSESISQVSSLRS